jgi:selenocysteine lyase/cysteine desulfurase
MMAPRKFTELLPDCDETFIGDIAAQISETQPLTLPIKAHEDKIALMNFIESDVVGSDASIQTVFGDRHILYADYTASGRALRVFEDYIRHELLPFYANTHTTASATGTQTTLFRAEAREIVLRVVGGDRSKDAVLFTGTGCTGAVVKLVYILSRSSEWQESISRGHQPLVLIGPYEHHSNILPWRESGARVVAVREAAGGGVDMEHLDELLIEHSAIPFKARHPQRAPR